MRRLDASDGQRLAGKRVTVRARTGRVAASGRPEMTDVVGHIIEIDDTHLRVTDRRDVTHTILIDDVVILKVVPDQPTRRRQSGAGPHTTRSDGM